MMRDLRSAVDGSAVVGFSQASIINLSDDIGNDEKLGVAFRTFRFIPICQKVKRELKTNVTVGIKFDDSKTD